MTKYYRFIKGTKAWEALNKCFIFQRKWRDNMEEIERFLGFPLQDNLYYDINTLIINPKVMPDEWKDQFKKNTSPAVAKSKSKINKQWVELCERLGLEVHTVSAFSFTYDIYGGGTYHSMFGDYYFAHTKPNNLFSEELTKKIMEEIPEIEFLELRARHLKDAESQAS